MKKIIPFILLVLLISCEQKPVQDFPENNPIIGIASPVKLSLGANEIYLTDYFTDISAIDSVFINTKKLKGSRDGERVFFRAPQDLLPISIMKVWIKGESFEIPVIRSKKVSVDFRFDPGTEIYDYVAIASEFNGWVAARNELFLENGIWSTTLYLDPGTYQYQLVLNDIQGLDPSNQDSIDNNVGGYNSVFKVLNKAAGSPPVLITKEIDEEEIDLNYKHKPDRVLAFWQNSLLDTSFIELDDDEVEIYLPEQAKSIRRSYIRIWAYNEAGLSNDILVPLEYGMVVEDAAALDRSDIRKI